jgi:hypothetical protein
VRFPGLLDAVLQGVPAVELAAPAA